MAPMPDDPFGLGRFVAAQERIYPSVLAELAAGKKRSHWMWFIFPQFAGLGISATAQLYAIGSLGEARAYLAHPLLGPRLRECTALVNRIEGRSARAIFRTPDDLKFRSSMTLFAHAGDDNRVFLDAIEKYFAGKPDRRTLDLIGESAA